MPFERGDTIYLQIVNARYDALFQVTAAGADLTPPPLVPVAGEAELKLVKALLPDRVQLGAPKAGAAEQAGPAKQNEFLGAIMQTDPAEARKQWTAFLKPFADAVEPYWSFIDRPVTRLDGALERHRDDLTQFLTRADGLNAASSDATMTYLDLRIDFERLLEAQARIANDIADLYARLSVQPAVRSAFAVNEAPLAGVVSRVLGESSLVAQRKILTQLAGGGISLPSDSVLSTNLAAFSADIDKVRHWAAVSRLAAEEKTVITKITEINNLLLQAAFRMNTLPSQLPQEVGEYRLGRWFDNKTVTVTISAAPRFAKYSAGATIHAAPEPKKSPSSDRAASESAGGPIPHPGPEAFIPEAPRTKGAKPDSGMQVKADKREAGKPNNDKPTDGSPESDDEPASDAAPKFVVDPQVEPEAPAETKTVATAVFEVHQLYHFRIAPGFVYSNLNDVQYDTSSRQVSDGVDDDGKPKTKEEKYLIQTRDRDHQMFPTINLIWYPFARDLFPGKWKPAVGVLAGLSLVDPRRDFVAGFSLEFTPAVSLYLGRHFGYQPDLPPGIAPGDALPANEPAFVENRLAHGTFFGLTFDLTIFKQLFGALGF
jgi:hypothetical protein